jgi:hypothetical protein
MASNLSEAETPILLVWGQVGLGENTIIAATLYVWI